MKFNLSQLDIIEKLYLEPNIFQVPFKKAYQSNNNYEYNIIKSNFLGQLKNWHTYGGQSCFITFYESIDEPAWFCTNLRYSESLNVANAMTECIDHNEQNNRLKFYCLLPSNVKNEHQNLILDSNQIERYDWIDEYNVPEKTMAKFTHAWQTLYGRTLADCPTTVRCYFLKNKYRTI
jgi:hypothetical protein